MSIWVLHIAVDPFNTYQPALPPVVAQLQAQSCNWMLYTLEQSTFLHSQCQHSDYQVYELLAAYHIGILSLFDDLMLKDEKKDL